MGNRGIQLVTTASNREATCCPSSTLKSKVSCVCVCVCVSIVEQHYIAVCVYACVEKWTSSESLICVQPEKQVVRSSAAKAPPRISFHLCVLSVCVCMCVFYRWGEFSGHLLLMLCVCMCVYVCTEVCVFRCVMSRMYVCACLFFQISRMPYTVTFL